MTLVREGRREVLLTLARDYDVSRARVRELMRQYLILDLDSGIKLRILPFFFFFHINLLNWVFV